MIGGGRMIIAGLSVVVEFVVCSCVIVGKSVVLEEAVEKFKEIEPK